MTTCQTPCRGFCLKFCKECHTPHFGGFLSCHDPHCPTCSGDKRESYTKQLCETLFKVKYYCYVFTLPHEVNDILDHKQPDLYAQQLKLFMDTASHTIQEMATDGSRHSFGNPDIITFLHTWDQKLDKHIHVHILVSAGGYDSKNAQWKDAPYDNFLFPVKKVARVFQKKFIEGLKELKPPYSLETNTFISILNKISSKDFNIHCSAPQEKEEYSTPCAKVMYLASYVNRVGISPQRIRSIKNGSVFIRRKRAPENLPEAEKESYDFDNIANCFVIPLNVFLELFCTHILPKYFKRVRRYGISKIKIKESVKIPAKWEKEEVEKIIKGHKQRNSKESPPQKPSVVNNFKIIECKDCQSKEYISLMFDCHGNPLSQYPENIENNEFIKEVALCTAKAIEIFRKERKLLSELTSIIRKEPLVPI